MPQRLASNFYGTIVAIAIGVPIGILFRKSFVKIS
jgi:hypothetical protein